MSFEEQIREAAKMVWLELSKRTHLYLTREKAEFSPKNLWAIEKIFELEQAHNDVQVIESLPMNGRNDFSNLGAYIGEIVRRNIEGCEWNGDVTPQERIELRLPGNRPPLFPMDLICNQRQEYKPGSIVKWGEDAGLKVGQSRKFHPVQFKPPSQPNET